MKAISLHQPYPSLCVTRQPTDPATFSAFGGGPIQMVKRFETRSWPCPPNLIGTPIALASTKQKPADGQLIGEWLVRRRGQGDIDYPHGDNYMRREGQGEAIDLQLGAIVGSAVIEACYPIFGYRECPGPPMAGHPKHICVGPHEDGTQLLLVTHMHDIACDISDQLPYGDYRPGRYAWLLTDAAPTTERCPMCQGMGDVPDWLEDPCLVCRRDGRCEPIPARGRQRIWNWQP